MRYIVICKDNTSFYTDRYNHDNFWNPETMFCVIDLACDTITFGNNEWVKIEEDSL